ncbi:MAG: hypothetical protein SV375_00090 [Thermodesulfobacteriota bacterium]|nr:hypothetical protein [Thermodesulfobacteriota bacterium]
MFKLELKTDLSDLKKLTKKYPEASRRAREAKIEEALLLLEAAVIKKTPYGAGPIHLRDTIHHKLSVIGNKVAGILGTPIEHGEPVEMGTKPHFPPVEPIQFWVEKKLGYEGKEAASVAFLIARAISKRGTEGAKMFEEGFEENEGKVIMILNEIPGEIERMVAI